MNIFTHSSIYPSIYLSILPPSFLHPSSRGMTDFPPFIVSSSSSCVLSCVLTLWLQRPSHLSLSWSHLLRTHTSDSTLFHSEPLLHLHPSPPLISAVCFVCRSAKQMDQHGAQREKLCLNSTQSVSCGTSIRSRLIGGEPNSNWKCNIDLCLVIVAGLDRLKSTRTEEGEGTVKNTSSVCVIFLQPVESPPAGL